MFAFAVAADKELECAPNAGIFEFGMEHVSKCNTYFLLSQLALSLLLAILTRLNKEYTLQLTATRKGAFRKENKQENRDKVTDPMRRAK